MNASASADSRAVLGGTYAGGLLHLDLAGLAAAGPQGAPSCPEPPPASWLSEYAGGRGWGIRWLTDLHLPGGDALAAESPLLFVTGPLGATKARGFSRWIVMAKSPLTGALARSVCGGDFGAALRFAGVDALGLTGSAPALSILVLEASAAGGSAAGPGLRARILPAPELAGRDTQDTQELLRARFGRRAQIACIGPAGENGVRYAAIVHGTRTAARCGVGTVMGSKNLKAVVVLAPNRPLEPADPASFNLLVKDHLARLTAHPRFRNMRAAGTLGMVEKVHQLGMLPVKNFQVASMEGLENL